MQGAETIALWTPEMEGADRCEVGKHVEDEFVENEIMDTFVHHEEPGASPHEDYMKLSEVERLTDDNIKTAVEVATRHVVTRIVEKTIEEAFSARYDLQQEVMKTPIQNMVESTVINIVEQRRLDTILVRNVDRVENWHVLLTL